MMQMMDTLKNLIYHTNNHISENPNEYEELQKQSVNAAITTTLRQELQELREMIKMMVDNKSNQ